MKFLRFFLLLSTFAFGDLSYGAPNLIDILSRGAKGFQPNQICLNARISDNGRHVIFNTLSTNLTKDSVIKDKNRIFGIDRLTGKLTILSDAFPKDKLLSSSASESTLSGDGKTLAFIGSYLPRGTPFNPNPQVIVGSTFSTNSLVAITNSQTSTGAYAPISVNSAPSLSYDGKILAFITQDHLILGGSEFTKYPSLVLYKYNEEKKIWEIHRSVRIGTFDDMVVEAKLSGDGKFVAYTLFDGETTNRFQQKRIILQNLETNEVVRADGGAYAFSLSDISSDGKLVTFESLLDNIVSGDDNEKSDCFLFDSSDESVKRVSLKEDGKESPHGGTECKLSSNSEYILFRRAGGPDDDTDDDHSKGYYRRNLKTGKLDLASASMIKGTSSLDLTGSDGGISNNGETVVFISETRLIKNDSLPRGTSSSYDVYFAQFETASKAPKVSRQNRNLLIEVPKNIKGEKRIALAKVGGGKYLSVSNAVTKKSKTSLSCPRPGSYIAFYVYSKDGSVLQSKLKNFKIMQGCNLS